MRKPSSLLPRRPARVPSARERIVGRGILLLLAGLLVIFIVAGGRQGPPSLIAGEAPEVVTPLAITSPGGWPRGEIELYDVEGLYEKINGKDAGYIAYDVVDLEFAGYANPEDPSLYVDVYLYDMAEPLNAFGIYRAQRSGKEQAVPVGEEACASGSAFFARKGRHYVEVIGSGDAATDEARAVLGAVVAALPAGDAPVEEPAWFPDEGRTRVLYVREGALGVESLGDAFLARYADGAQAAVARFEKEESAEAARKEAQESFEFLGTPAVFVVEGARVIGAIGVKDTKRLESLVAATRTRVKEAP